MTGSLNWKYLSFMKSPTHPSGVVGHSSQSMLGRVVGSSSVATSLRSWRFLLVGKPGQNEWCSCGGNGARAGSTSGFAAKNRFSLLSPHFPAASPLLLARLSGEHTNKNRQLRRLSCNKPLCCADIKE